MADSLRAMLAAARRAQPDLPEEAWSKMEQAIRQQFGGQDHYIAAQRKRERHVQLDKNPEADVQKLAAMLGVSVRHVRRLKRGK